MTRPEKFYTCFVENRGARDVILLEQGGTPFRVVPPSDAYTVYSTRPYENIYSRYSKITFEASGAVSVKMNKDWPVPESWANAWLLTALNAGPHQVESLRIDEQLVHLYRGLPITLPVALDDNHVWYAELIIHEVEETTPDPQRLKYIVRRKVVRLERTLRPEKDLHKIYDALAAKLGADGVKRLTLPPDVFRALGLKREESVPPPSERVG